MSSISTLSERINSYSDTFDHKLLTNIPKIILINGRNFRKTTSLLAKPFSDLFLELMCGTMIKLLSEIEGAKLVYSFNDEFVIAMNNNIHEDQWYNGSMQKIASAAAAIATYEFNRLVKENKYELFGDPIFTAQVFSVPNITELCNVFVSKQQQAFHTSISSSCFYELSKLYDMETVKQALSDKSTSAKAEILSEKCNVNFNNYSLPFKRGFGCYRTPKIGYEEIKSKIVVDMELPIFTKNPEFLETIFRQIFRK